MGCFRQACGISSWMGQSQKNLRQSAYSEWLLDGPLDVCSGQNQGERMHMSQSLNAIDGSVFLAYLLSGLPGTSDRLALVRGAVIKCDGVKFSITYMKDRVAQKIKLILVDQDQNRIGSLKKNASCFKAVLVGHGLLNDINENYPPEANIRDAKQITDNASKEVIKTSRDKLITKYAHQVLNNFDELLFSDDLMLTINRLSLNCLSEWTANLKDDNDDPIDKEVLQEIFDRSVEEIALYYLAMEFSSTNLVLFDGQDPRLVFSSKGLEIIDLDNQKYATNTDKKIFSCPSKSIYVDNVEQYRLFDRIRFNEESKMSDLYKIYSTIINKYKAWKSIVINNYPEFINLKKARNRGRSGTNSKHRVTVCWRCHQGGLDNSQDLECTSCGWIICPGCFACDSDCEHLADETLLQLLNNIWKKSEILYYYTKPAGSLGEADYPEDDIPF